MMKTSPYPVSRALVRFRSAVATGASLGIVFGMSGCSQPLGVSPGLDPMANQNTFGSGIPRPDSAVATGRTRQAVANPNVVRGLEIAPHGTWTVSVGAGSCSIDGKIVTLQEAQLLEAAPPSTVQIQDDTLIAGPGRKMRLSKVPTVGAEVDASSLKLSSGAGATSHLYRAGTDYTLDPKIGELTWRRSTLPSPGALRASYAVRLPRLDTIEVTPAGKVLLKKGETSPDALIPPHADSGSLAIATLLVQGSATRLNTSAIYPIGPAFPPLSASERQAMAAAILHTRSRLQAGEKVTLAFWGDSSSVPGGTSAISDLTKRLEGDFKDARLETLDALEPSGTLAGMLPRLSSTVLSHHPDLVMISFAAGQEPIPAFRREILAAIQQIRSSGAEVMLVTPVQPGVASESQARSWSTQVVTLREVARQEHVGLADMARRWEHLKLEGYPEVALLYNNSGQANRWSQPLFSDLVSALF